MRRILTLPISETDEEVWVGNAEHWTKKLQKPWNTTSKRPCVLRPVQGGALQEICRNVNDYVCGVRAVDEDGEDLGPRGLLGPIGVGHGKTGISFLIPEVVRRLTGDVRALLIVPPDLVRKTEVDYAWWARRFRFPRPTILSMGKLSHPSATSIFEQIRPNIIIIDEAHRFASMDSARTKRLIRWVVEHRDTLCVFMSGTLTSKSMQDYRHLAELALRDCVPMPSDQIDLELWQSLIDVGGTPNYNAKKAMLPLINWHRERQDKPLVKAGGVTKALARDAFSDRLRACPGVVATSGSSCDAALVIRKWKVDAPPSWEEACEQFDNEDGNWEMPDGEEVVDALSAGRAKTQLSSGYYTRWVWPIRCGVCHTPHPGHEFDCDGEPVTGIDHEWMDARREWKSVERAIVGRLNAKTGEDSPALVRDLARKGKFGTAERRLLSAWEAVKPRYFTPNLGYQPPVEYVDLEPGPEWLAERAREWASVVKRGIIWYSTPHVGRALSDAGFEVFGRGTDLQGPSALRLDHPCAKIDVQGTGKNLQMVEDDGAGFVVGWHRNLILEFGGNAKIWEQMIGRTHRTGQIADEVRVDILFAGSQRMVCFHSAKIGSEYIERTMAMEQKLRIATYGDDVTDVGLLK